MKIEIEVSEDMIREEVQRLAVKLLLDKLTNLKKGSSE